MPSTIPEGSAIRLGPIMEAIGIAEGIDALAASLLFEMPVWAAINTSRMKLGCHRRASRRFASSPTTTRILAAWLRPTSWRTG